MTHQKPKLKIFTILSLFLTSCVLAYTVTDCFIKVNNNSIPGLTVITGGDSAITSAGIRGEIFKPQHLKNVNYSNEYIR
jgi:hypothetical protein